MAFYSRSDQLDASQQSAAYFQACSQAMGNSHDRLNFDPGKTDKIFHHSWKERLKISRIAKFGGEML